jgi:integrase
MDPAQTSGNVTMTRAANLLQVRSIECARPKGVDYYLRDGAGLFVRVYPSGRKTFAYRFDAGGRARRIEHPSPFGKGPGTLTLNEARAWRAELDALRRQGVDPVAHELAKRGQLRRAVAASVQANSRAVVPADVDYPPGSFGAIAREYFARVIARRHRRPESFLAVLNRALLPGLGARPIDALRLGDVQAVLNPIVDAGTPVAANRALLTAKQVFKYAHVQGHIESNPIAGITRRDVGGAEAQRERNLSWDEIRTLWRVLTGAAPVRRTVREFTRRDGRPVKGYAREGVHLGWQARACLQMLLLCGQRAGETLAARWGDVDLAGGLWRIPPANAKSGRAHLVHLPALAVELLRSLPGKKPAEGFIFAAEGTATPAPIDRHVVTRALDRLLSSGALALEPFTPHDLRRTVRSRLSDLGVLPHVAEKVLAHKLQGVWAVYDRAEYLPERAAAMAAWDAKLRELIGG